MRRRPGQPADPGPVAPSYCSDRGRQGRPRPGHHRRGLPGTGSCGEVDRGKDPERGNVLLPAAADSRGAPARSPGQRPDVRHPRPAHSGRADRPVRHRVRPRPGSADGLPPGTAPRCGLLDPADDRPHPGQAVLARPGTASSRHQLAAPVPGAGGRLEGQDHPQGAARDRGRPGIPPDRRGQRPVHGPRVLPRHRPVGRRRPVPVGAVGGTVPDPGRGDTARERAVPAQGEDGPADPRTASGPPRSCQVRRGRPACLSGTARRLRGGRPRRDVHRRRAGTAPGGHGQGGKRPDLGRGSRRRPPPRPDPRRAPGLLGMGRDRGPPSHRDQDRGAHRAVAPQPGPVPAAVHRRAHPAAADRPVQDRRRAAPGHQPRARRCPVGDHHPDPRRRRCRPARRVLRRQRETLEPADAAAVPAPGSGQRTVPSPRRRSGSS